jgi:hypothetical protein
MLAVAGPIAVGVLAQTAKPSEFEVASIRPTPTPPAGRPERLHGHLGLGGKPAPSIFRMVQEQLGLKLQSREGPVDILLVEHAERPSAN